MGLFPRLARLVTRHTAAVIIVWGIGTASSLALAIGGVGDGGLFERMETGAPAIAGSDSEMAGRYAPSVSGEGEGTRMTTAVLGVSPTDPVVAEALGAAFADVARVDGVGAIISPLGMVPGMAASSLAPSNGTLDPLALVAADGNGFLVVVLFATVDENGGAYASHAEVERLLDAALARVDATSYSFSLALLFHDFEGIIERDLLRGELVAIPVALIAMVLVFGGFLAASTPIAGALASIAAGLAALLALSYPLTLNSSAVNIVSILGVGLSIDYGLLIVSRYREELIKVRPRGGTRESRTVAMETALNTAGRTVLYSGVIVALSVGAMATFQTEMMRGFGAAGLLIVTFAVVSALTLVPAVAFSFGPHVGRPSVLRRIPLLKWVLHHTANVQRDTGALASLAGWIQQRPWFVLITSSALVVILAAPVLAFIPRNSQAELLPADFERRQFIDVMSESFPAADDPDILVVARTSPASLDTWLADATSAESAIGNAVRFSSTAATKDGMAVAGVELVTKDRGGPEAVDVVRGLRATDAPFEVWIGGQAAGLIDFGDAIASGGLLALAVIILAVMILLFLMTGSLIMPVKALAVNSLSLAATMGIMVWLFQYGNLSGILGFDPPGGIEIYVVISLVCFGFGLAMDYEVFLVSRIKELIDQGMPNDQAVRVALQRSGRIITSAAAIIILVFVGFAFGDLLVIKEVGFGLAIAVFLDATLVRMFLVPATMTLLGDWNWWAPKPLKRLHARLHITH